ncbi:SRPBCC domain-containing protein [Mucilaginibacter conchicola]|uniref:SRPBCC domain-containing protein n=1 Tax=Mucilaginibacter conchicola TaxID=2303333 RepID=A0A372NUA7_9SPHI|nr:SRPBCC domain-containing protein [Mucilaginibacter conchicola]RFZ92491.1 SRPBCC domain-containing protein [Mucilaginibacter conchicola]
MEDLKISFTVPQTPSEVFEAVTNVRGWWLATLDGESADVGDEFVYRHGDLHYSRHRLTEVVPDKKVVWLTTDSSINFVDDKTEWTGTTVTFDILQKDGLTTLEFTHQGLVPQLECFEACTGGWQYYIDSLRQLIVSGEGHPDNKA